MYLPAMLPEIPAAYFKMINVTASAKAPAIAMATLRRFCKTFALSFCGLAEL